MTSGTEATSPSKPPHMEQSEPSPLGSSMDKCTVPEAPVYMELVLSTVVQLTTRDCPQQPSDPLDMGALVPW